MRKLATASAWWLLRSTLLSIASSNRCACKFAEHGERSSEQLVTCGSKHTALPLTSGPMRKRSRAHLSQAKPVVVWCVFNLDDLVLHAKAIRVNTQRFSE